MLLVSGLQIRAAALDDLLLTLKSSINNCLIYVLSVYFAVWLCWR